MNETFEAAWQANRAKYDRHREYLMALSKFQAKRSDENYARLKDTAEAYQAATVAAYAAKAALEGELA